MSGSVNPLNRPTRLLRYARRSFYVWVVAWTATVVTDVLDQSGWLTNLAHHSSKLAIWASACGLLLLASYQFLDWASMRYSVLAFSVFLVGLHVIKVTRAVEELDAVPLVGRSGAFTSILRHALSATASLAFGYYVYLILVNLNQSYEALERRVYERTAELRETNERLAAEVAQRRNSEEAEREIRSQLDHCHRLASLGEISSTLAHEINQPLGVITNLVNASLREAERGHFEPDEVRQTLTHVRELTVSASSILRRLRPLVRKNVDDPCVGDLNDLVGGVVQFMLPECSRRQVSLNVQLAEELAPVNFSRVQIQQVLVNLLGNSVDAMSPMMGPKSIFVRTATEGDLVSVAVEDTGPPVPGDVVSRMFDAYFTTKSDGLGLGLVICRSIVGEHGGKIQAKAQPAGGMVVKFWLPVSHDKSRKALVS